MSQLTIGAAWRAVRDRFRAAGLGTPELDARRLAEIAFGMDSLQLISEERQPVEPASLATLEALTLRRLTGEPVARIAGRKEFYGLSFHLNAATLVPRPETEQLVDLALAFLKNKPAAKILDLGTGTGAIPISILANNPEVTAIAVDISPEALVGARTNAALHSVDDRLETRAGSWFDPIGPDEKFDIIISNPPYIDSDVIKGLAADVRDHDPMLALDGGADGLNAYRTIASQARNHLDNDGMLMVEIGSGQGESVAQLLKDAGFTTPVVEKDLAGLDRVVSTHHVHDK